MSSKPLVFLSDMNSMNLQSNSMSSKPLVFLSDMNSMNLQSNSSPKFLVSELL